jgi:hypothetical protein
MTKPTNETKQPPAPKQQQLSDLDLDVVNGGRQTPSQSFGQMVRNGNVVSGGSGAGGS